MPASKIVDEQELVRWIEEGRPYGWMVEEYLRKYNLETTPSMFANFRRRRGLDARLVRNEDLIPWHVLPKHRWLYPLQMLRTEARRRAGKPLREGDVERLTSWLVYLNENNLVVYYDPDLEDGFVYIPRSPDDKDIIHP